MAVFDLEDLQGSVEVVVFPELFRNRQSLLNPDHPIVVRGKAELEDGRWRIIAEEIAPLAGAAERRATRLVLSVDASSFPRDRVERIQALLRDHPGECPVLFRFLQSDGGAMTLRPDPSVRVGPTPVLTHALEAELGPGAVRYR
jgi:DNA polymerase-3 subunit alpha